MRKSLSLLVFCLFLFPVTSTAQTPECTEAKAVWEDAHALFHETRRALLADFKAGVIDEATKDAGIDEAEAVKDAAEEVKDAVCDDEEDE